MSSGQHGIYNVAHMLRQTYAAAWACPGYVLFRKMVLHQIRDSNFAKVADSVFKPIDDPD